MTEVNVEVGVNVTKEVAAMMRTRVVIDGVIAVLRRRVYEAEKAGNEFDPEVCKIGGELFNRVVDTVNERGPRFYETPYGTMFILDKEIDIETATYCELADARWDEVNDIFDTISAEL